MSEDKITTSNPNFDEIKYTITIDTTCQHSKPMNYNIGGIKNKMNLTTGLTINEFYTYVAQPYGYTWSGGLFEGKICNENWKQQSVFGIDFDKGLITVEEVLARLNQMNIHPQLWYSSFSATEQLRKFRVVLFVDAPVKEESIRKMITEGLLSLFPEADKKCKDASRIFFGGKDSAIINYAPVSTENLINAMGIELITKDGGRTRKVPVDIFDSENGCNIKTGKKGDLLYNYYRNSRISPELNKKTTYIKGGEIIDFAIARKRIKLLDEFLNGTWLYHDHLFGLASNLIYIKGGRKLMNETMHYYNTAGKTFYTENNFNINTYLNRVDYPPIPVYSFSPYAEDQEVYDIISATKDIRGLIEQTAPINKVSLKQAETLFKTKFEEVKEDTEGGIHLFRLPTAIGKTEAILSSTGTIAAPTNQLKEDIGNRMRMPFMTTPDSIVFESEILNKKLNYYYSIGLPTKATALLHSVIGEKGQVKYPAADIERVRDYLNQLQSSYYSNLTVLTTHDRALHSQFTHDTIIFDEDPLNSLIDIKQVRISDIQKLDNQTLLLNNNLINVIGYLKTAIPGEIVTTPIFALDVDELIEKLTYSSIQTNIFELFNSSYLIKDTQDYDLIHYVVKRNLPKKKKIIILSATLPVYIYKKLYGDRVKVTDMRDVEQQGTIIQYTKRSCSRHSLGRYVTDVSREVGDKPVITFKSFAHHFKNPVEGMHFGNCSGYDNMKGQNLVVVGTPHRNMIEYLLTAKVMGIEFKTTDTTMSYQKIEYNGFKFKFNCFDNEELRNIQLSLIESDLIQAVGRARTLRTDATVEVYSNFPLRLSNEFR